VIYKNRIIEHILYFPVIINSGKNAITTISLAPMSVKPDYKKQGFGGALIKAGLKRAKEPGF